MLKAIKNLFKRSVKASEEVSNESHVSIRRKAINDPEACYRTSDDDSKFYKCIDDPFLNMKRWLKILKDDIYTICRLNNKPPKELKDYVLTNYRNLLIQIESMLIEYVPGTNIRKGINQEMADKLYEETNMVIWKDKEDNLYRLAYCDVVIEL